MISWSKAFSLLLSYYITNTLTVLETKSKQLRHARAESENLALCFPFSDFFFPHMSQCCCVQADFIELFLPIEMVCCLKKLSFFPASDVSYLHLCLNTAPVALSWVRQCMAQAW